MRAEVSVLPLLVVMFVGECKAVPPEQGTAQTPAAQAGQATAPAAKEKEEETPVLVGPVTREKVEEAVPAWVQAEVEAAPEPAAVQALAAVPAGAEVTVFLG